MLGQDDDGGVQEGVGEDPVGEMWCVESCTADETTAVEVEDCGLQVVGVWGRGDEDVYGYLDAVDFFVIG